MSRSSSSSNNDHDSGSIGGHTTDTDSVGSGDDNNNGQQQQQQQVPVAPPPLPPQPVQMRLTETAWTYALFVGFISWTNKGRENINISLRHGGFSMKTARVGELLVRAARDLFNDNGTEMQPMTQRQYVDYVETACVNSSHRTVVSCNYELASMVDVLLRMVRRRCSNFVHHYQNDVVTEGDLMRYARRCFGFRSLEEGVLWVAEVFQGNHSDFRACQEIFDTLG